LPWYKINNIQFRYSIITILKRKVVVVEKKVILTLTLFTALIGSTASTLVFVLEQQYNKHIHTHRRS
jgi:hypothetical protein